MERQTSMTTSTQNAVLPLPNQSTDPMPVASSSAFAGPVWGASWNSFWNSRPTATVGSTTGKNTSVRTSAEARRSQNTYSSASTYPATICPTVTVTPNLRVNHSASWAAASSHSRAKFVSPVGVKPSSGLPVLNEYPSDHTI